MRIKPLVIVLSLIVSLSGCSSTSTPSSSNSSSSDTSANGVHVSGALGTAPVITFDSMTTAPTSLVIKDIAVGTGVEAMPSSTVTTHYIGYGLNTKQKFDSSWDRGQPISFGLNQVIQGWSQGIPGMKVGGRRLLIIPGDLAYGANPPPGGSIQPNEPLVFVVDLTAVQ